MSRYLLLVLLNAPFILSAVAGAFINFKLKKISQRQFYKRVGVWIFILIGLILAEPIYTYLFTRGLTQTEPLSLFDVIQITAIVWAFYIISRTRSRVNLLERKVNDLHQEISIRLSAKNERP